MNAAAPTLHSTTLGEQGSPVVFCHGLFGQGKNWTQVAKQVAEDHRVLLLDMPHHGRSGWTDSFDYVESADIVAGAVRDLGSPVALVGHSMGGKIAMLLALRHPELVERLCVVDVAPVGYGDRDEFAGYMDAMLRMDLGALASRADADAALVEAVPNRTVRSFLLQNLHRVTDSGAGEAADGPGWRWQPNLEVLRRDLAALGGWPADAVEGASYDGPVLWVGGARSEYITADHVAAMDGYFPGNRRVTVKDAGHWVHSEQPGVFTEVLRRFLATAASGS